MVSTTARVGQIGLDWSKLQQKWGEFVNLQREQVRLVKFTGRAGGLVSEGGIGQIYYRRGICQTYCISRRNCSDFLLAQLRMVKPSAGVGVIG